MLDLQEYARDLPAFQNRSFVGALTQRSGPFASEVRLTKGPICLSLDVLGLTAAPSPGRGSIPAAPLLRWFDRCFLPSA